MDIGLLLLRLAIGLTLAAHGAQKLFGWFGGPGLETTGRLFDSLGFRPGRRHALMAGVVESGGGLLLAFGLVTLLGAALVVSVMLVAAISVHLKNGFFIMSGGYEYALTLAVGALALAFTGPGIFSVDAAIGSAVHGAIAGLGAFAVAVVGAVVQLAQRQSSPVTPEVATAR